MSTNVESSPYCRLLASISVLSGREEGASWAWKRYPEREEVAGLEGAEGDWRPDLVNTSAENNSLGLAYKCRVWDESGAMICSVAQYCAIPRHCILSFGYCSAVWRKENRQGCDCSTCRRNPHLKYAWSVPSYERLQTNYCT